MKQQQRQFFPSQTSESFPVYPQQTENEVGACVDYAISVRHPDSNSDRAEIHLGVSVTRSITRPDLPYTIKEAERLLVKKLNRVNTSNYVYSELFSRQILHIWSPDQRTTGIVKRAYSKLRSREGGSKTLLANTIILITTAKEIPEIFTNTNG